MKKEKLRLEQDGVPSTIGGAVGSEGKTLLRIALENGDMDRFRSLADNAEMVMELYDDLMNEGCVDLAVRLRDRYRETL